MANPTDLYGRGGNLGPFPTRYTPVWGPVAQRNVNELGYVDKPKDVYAEPWDPGVWTRELLGQDLRPGAQASQGPSGKQIICGLFDFLAS